MTQEEKAKRYDEAIERARALNNGEAVNIKIGTTTCEYIFPELKESEDERIRKELIDFVKSRLAGFPECGRFIAWLEKQDIFSKKDIDDAYLKGVTDTKNEIEKQYEANYQIRKDIATFLFNYKGDIKDRSKWMNYLGVFFVEKQGEKPQGKSALEAINEEKVDNQNCVKPTDKVESRFHEGDWIISYSNGTVVHVNDIKKDIHGTLRYYIEFLNGSKSDPMPCFVDSEYQLWTIQDAKDGDVLFHSDSASNGIFIFKGILQRGDDIQEVICYCDYDSEDGFCLGEYHTCCWADSKILYPATKERRDLLFQKLKEAGYVWDAENKTLEKIVPKFKVGDWVVDNYSCVWKIEGILNQFYVLECPEGGESRPTTDWADRNFHLWTIQDAKDGDVLSVNWREGANFWERIIIFKKYHSKDVEGLINAPYVEGYGNTFKNGKLIPCAKVPYYSTWTDNLYPATKEQRDLLFQTMKEAGYEWDADNKELKRVLIK